MSFAETLRKLELCPSGGNWKTLRRSAYSRNHLKERLYAEGLKRPICEMCGQGSVWLGRPLGMILDHINGVRDDNRIENLQIVCPNCAATLDTHCGRKNRLTPRKCNRCGVEYQPRSARQQYCSRQCGIRYPRTPGPQPSAWKVPRPPYRELLREIADHGWSAVGRKYGVSGNAVRKWVQAYERWQSQG
jgi:HNH endonuclease